MADMNGSSTTVPSVSIHRAALQGYLLVLLGFLFVIENALSVLTASVSGAHVSGLVLGLFGIGGGVLGYSSPERFPRGTEPAPTYLYVLAGVATVAFVFSILLI
ncbi:hypothetical protein [Halomicrobium zhouii]|uniref:hypothetical protein n=1 Tax=Halomicrobium zhouii TaxID=767519 RepID=UPI000B7FD4C6|nr:hypothetical protein [Halomicrobium zhouii]